MVMKNIRYLKERVFPMNQYGTTKEPAEDYAGFICFNHWCDTRILLRITKDGHPDNRTILNKWIIRYNNPKIGVISVICPDCSEEARKHASS